MKKLMPKTVIKLFWSIGGIGAVIGLIGVGYEAEPLMITGIAVMMSAIVFKLFFYRCPHCGGYLDRNAGEFCHKCGKRLFEKPTD